MNYTTYQAVLSEIAVISGNKPITCIKFWFKTTEQQLNWCYKEKH